MLVSDLGQFDGDVIVFGGPYSNAQATKALIAKAKALNIAPDHCICTGDVVAYCADAVETVRLIRDFGCPVIAGNCDKQLGQGAQDCGCGFEKGTTCDALSVAWFSHADRVVGAEDRAWMQGLPDLAVFTHSGKRYGVLHGGVTDVARFLWSSTVKTALSDEIAAFEDLAGPLDVILAGHSGIPFIRTIGRHCWVNAGVIGMPPHDAGVTTRFVLIKDGLPEIHDLSYDHLGAAAAMTAVGMTQGYHSGLTTGLWPSEDALPLGLRRRLFAQTR